MINLEDYDILKNNISTLKETSKDNHNNESETFMTQSMLPAVDFDEVKNEYIRKLHLSENPTSNDALLVLSDKIIFIEFKNGHLDSKDFFDIRAKIYNSVPILTDILGKGISFTRKNVDYILVYNKTKNSKNYIKNHINKIIQSVTHDRLDYLITCRNFSFYMSFRTKKHIDFLLLLNCKICSNYY